MVISLLKGSNVQQDLIDEGPSFMRTLGAARETYQTIIMNNICLVVCQVRDDMTILRKSFYFRVIIVWIGLKEHLTEQERCWGLSVIRS